MYLATIPPMNTSKLIPNTDLPTETFLILSNLIMPCQPFHQAHSAQPLTIHPSALAITLILMESTGFPRHLYTRILTIKIYLPTTRNLGLIDKIAIVNSDQKIHILLRILHRILALSWE
jgi:hypothetical protein